MLAQTQVARVAGKWPEFMARFPTPAALASAPLGEVLALWQGLGYPRRAEALRRAAAAIVAEHGGVVPDAFDALGALPGIGEYTARAVRAFAFDAPELPVDTNIGRVLARAVSGRPLSRVEARELARAAGGGRTRAMAVMDFGAGVCTAKAPACGSCPLGGASPVVPCAWRAADRTSPEGGHEGVASSQDPVRGSFGVSARQSRFAGSDREGRGRLLRTASRATISSAELDVAAGWPGDLDRARRVADSLVEDRLLERTGDGYRMAE
jgi:A/G-specific adenine glycosylase